MTDKNTKEAKAKEPSMTDIRHGQMLLVAKEQVEGNIGPLFKRALARAQTSSSTSFKVTMQVAASFDEETDKWCIQTTGTSNVDVKDQIKTEPAYIDLGQTLFDAFDDIN